MALCNIPMVMAAPSRGDKSRNSGTKTVVNQGRSKGTLPLKTGRGAHDVETRNQHSMFRPKGVPKDATPTQLRTGPNRLGIFKGWNNKGVLLLDVSEKELFGFWPSPGGFFEVWNQPRYAYEKKFDWVNRLTLHVGDVSLDVNQGESLETFWSRVQYEAKNTNDISKLVAKEFSLMILSSPD